MQTASTQPAAVADTHLATLVIVWTARLVGESSDLDFADADDRAIYRGRVARAFENAKHVVVRDFGVTLGLTIPRDRNQATRIIADAFITALRTA